MYATLAASAMLATTALASNVGKAVLYNACSYDVYLQAVPAKGGGFEQTDHTLKSGDTYVQPYTQLSNGQGWALKLSKTAGAFGSNIIQYEYTFHDDGTIWYDLSHVDGNPWPSDSNIAAIGGDGCAPKQAAYEFWNDDANGMQSCNQSATIAISVCTSHAGTSFTSSIHSLLNNLPSSAGSSADGSVLNNLLSGLAAAVTGGNAAGAPAPSVTTSAAAAPPTTTSASPKPVTTSTSPAAVPTTSTTPVAAPPTTSSSPAKAATVSPLGYESGHFVNEQAAAPAPTTLATVASQAMNGKGDLVTEMVVVTETAVATKIVYPRHEHGHHQH